MTRKSVRWINLAILPLIAILITSSGRFPARADIGSPAEMVQRAWRNVQGAGSYRFLSTADQALIPRPIPQMIGQTDVRLTLENDGAVVLPDRENAAASPRAYMELRVANNISALAGGGNAAAFLGGGRSNNPSLAILQDGSGAYMLQDGQLKPVQSTLNLASPTTDVLGWLAAAEEVALLPPPQDHPELSRYGFQLNGVRFEEYVRAQSQELLRSEPGAPEGLELKPSPVLQHLNGVGELWVNQAGLPVRQVLDIEMPEVSESYDARIHLVVDLSGYGQVEALPKAVQGADGTWRLDGALKTGAATNGAAANLAALSGVATQANQPTLPLRVEPSNVILLVAAVLVILIVRYYRRNPRRCYAIIVVTLIPIMVLTPLLQAVGVVRFVERQVQAAEARQAATPQMMQALGLASPTQTDQAGKAVAAKSLTELPLGVPSLDVAAKSAKTDEKLPAITNAPASGGKVQSNEQTSPMERCGEIDLNDTTDTDGDGLRDAVEVCLGTDRRNPDSDNDTITDRVEIQGFDWGGTHWYSDPLKADSNTDGLLDTYEWSSTLTPRGLAADPDFDGDGIPNLWDDDDDGDTVPDALDLSPTAVTGYTSTLSLSTAGSTLTGTLTIELEVQPQDARHLRYTMTALDWPNGDTDGNVQDADISTADLRLAPFLLVTTNVEPDATLSRGYGVSSWIADDGQIVLLVPMQPVEDGGAINTFYGKVGYAAGQSADIQWQAKLVWMAQMQNDTPDGHGNWNTETKILYEYPDSFRVTGLQISKSHNYEGAVFGTPTRADDLDLFKLYMGLNMTFLFGKTLDGQTPGQTALDALHDRFAAGSTATLTQTFGIPQGIVAMSGPTDYANFDVGMVGVGSELVSGLLDTWRQYYENGRCRDAEGHVVNCASLLLVSEHNEGVYDLEDFTMTDARTADLSQLHVATAAIPLVTFRTANLRVYEQGASSGEWQVITPARMLELVEARYKDSYNTVLADIYPDLRTEDARFIAYTSYVFAYTGRNVVAGVDGESLLPAAARESIQTVQGSLDATFNSVIDYMSLATGINYTGQNLFSAGTGFFDLYELYTDTSTGTKIRDASMCIVGLVTMGVSLIMNTINVACQTNSGLSGCGNAQALLVANLVVGTIMLAAQAVTLGMEILETIVEYIARVLKRFDAAAVGLGAIGAAVGATMAFISFGLAMWAANGDPVAVRMQVATLIITLVWLAITIALSCIPFFGAIIVGILDFFDAIIGLFTSLFADQGYSIATGILAFIYSATTNTTVDSAQFGEYVSSVQVPDLGLTAGNVFSVSVGASGVIKKVSRGTDGDLDKSYIQGELVDEGADYESTDTSQPRDCQMVEGELHCSNTAALSYVLTPLVNGKISFRPQMRWQTVWAEYAFFGGVRYDTETSTGTLPDPPADVVDIYLDALPASVDDLWNWPALTNLDWDGDGLAELQEAALGTDPTKWDTDGDGLSDKYEVDTFADRGSDPLRWDTDGDGLNDGLERRAGSRADVADTDGDGLTDGQEVRHIVWQDPGGWTLVGGWQMGGGGGAQASIPMVGGKSGQAYIAMAEASAQASFAAGDGAWVSSDPLAPDDDGDGLSASEEKANGLSPQAANSPVPTLSLSAAPIRGVPGGRAGSYWQIGEPVTFTVRLANGAGSAVTTTLALTLPSWLSNIQGGAMQGDRAPAKVQNGSQFSWSFAGANALQVMEQVSTTVTARVSTSSASDEIAVGLPYGDYQLRKSFTAVVDSDNPNVAIMAPADHSFQRGTSYVVGGTATDPTTWVTGAELSIVPQGNSANFQALSSTASPWAYTWSGIADGRYTLQARATDVMGHVGASGTVNVTFDNTAPTATVTATMTTGGVLVSGGATDNLAGIERVQFAIDGQPWRSASLSGAGTNSASWSYLWAVGPSAQGKHQVWARAFDRSGNPSAVVSQTIVVDKVAPSSLVTGGADKDLPPAVKASTTFTLTGVADEGGHLPLPAVPADLRQGMGVFADSTVWLGLSTIHDNDGGVLAAWVGDFNADRMADLAVGLPGPYGDAGQVAVLYGKAGGWPVSPDLEMLADSPTRFVGAAGARLGSYVAAAGDVNYDNASDLLIGERSSTRAFLVLGKGGALGKVTLDSGAAGYRTLLQAPATIEGLASAGDVNGDGYDDIFVRAGGNAYLLLGHLNPWSATVDVQATAALTLSDVTGALGVGDVNNDQHAEWVTMVSGVVRLYRWNEGVATLVSTVTTADTAPRVVALGDVDGDGTADWLYSSSGLSRTLVYGNGTTFTFFGYGGFFAAPGDVDGDGRADILFGDVSGGAHLIRRAAGGLQVLASVSGVAGAANAPYAAGADLNSDGSSELLLIPSASAAQAAGFDAPDFGSGFISPQSLPLGASSATDTGRVSDKPSMLRASGADLLSSTGPDTRYVDDDAVGNVCDGHSSCYTTIQAAVNATDGGGDTIIVYPGVYAPFSVPADVKYNNLTVQGVSPDAVFVDGSSADAIRIAADGVHIADLTVRNAVGGVVLEDGAGVATAAGGSETFVDRVLIHSSQYPITMSQGAALTLRDSTLAGDGTNAMVYVNPGPSSVHSWNNDQAMPSSTMVPITGTGALTGSGVLVGAGNNLYAMPGGLSAAVYQATPGAGGALGAWSQPFSLRNAPPLSTGTAPYYQGTSHIATSGSTLYQLQGGYYEPYWGGRANEYVRAVAVHPTTGDVYVGGDFTSIGGVDAFHIARWDGTSWNAVGSGLENGTNGTVYALTFDDSGKLYAGGVFTQAGTLGVGRLAGWDGSAWFPLGVAGGSSPTEFYNGVDGPVYALAYDPTPGSAGLYIGGSFSNAWSWGQAGWGRTGSVARNIVQWRAGCVPTNGLNCYSMPGYGVTGTVYALALSRGSTYESKTLYVGGEISAVADDSWTSISVSNVAAYDTAYDTWSAMGSGLGRVCDLAAEPSGHVYAATGAGAAGGGALHWDGTTWTRPGGQTPSAESSQVMRAFAVVVDDAGNVYVGSEYGFLFAQYGGSGDFSRAGQDNSPRTTTFFIYDLALDSSGRLWAASSAANQQDGYYGGLSRRAPAGLYTRPLPSGSWTIKPYLPAIDMWDQVDALAGDGAGNLYAVWRDMPALYTYTTKRLSYYDSAANTWTLKADPPADFYHLAYANGKLYALAHWALYSYDLASDTWAQLAAPSLSTSGAGLSMAWDGADYIYLLAGGGTSTFTRYRISANAWDSPTAPTGFTVSYGPAMARLGSYLYAYGTPGSGVTTNIFRYGAIPEADLRLTVERTAFVAPVAASTPWTNLSAQAGTYRFLTDIDTTNRWVAPSGTTWIPALPTGATTLTTAQAAFVAPADGLYRVGVGSSLGAGYHQYVAAAHVYPSQAACTGCGSGGLVWGETAFATVRQAVESGAARVQVHPGRYPQSFYLVSGVEVMGSGAETTIIEPPAGSAATLVTAEGVAHASLARLTLAGGVLWQGFLAEGGAKGLKVSRSIIRDLSTGVRLRGGSQVELVNNTIARNASGFVAEDTSSVNVRNTIFAYNTGTGLMRGASPASLSNTYNDFWLNGADMSPADVSLGSLFVNPRFRSLAGDDLRLAEGSPVIDMGAPNDPTVPGGGARVDMGYAEYSAAGFYVSKDYSEMGLNDGLTWGIDAFDQIQPALDAAAATMHDLQGALPAGGYTVGVDAGAYNERVSVPSHVRLVGSGAEVTTIDAGNASSAVTFDAVTDAEVSGFTLKNASSAGAGIEVKNASSGITIARNVIQGNAAHGVSFSGQSSGAVSFNTIVGNTGSGVYATGADTWLEARNNILDSNAYGLQAASSGLIRNDYNLLDNLENFDSVTAGVSTVEADPAFASGSYYVPSADSPAIDSADPQADVPLAGGVRADLGYKELLACPLTLVFGPQIASAVTGNSGVAHVEVGVALVSDATQPVTATLPTSWQTLTPGSNDQPLYYWSRSLSQATPGLYRAYSRATDAAGNVEENELDWYEGAFVVDNTAPTVTWGAPALPSSTSAAAVLAVAQAAGTVSTGTGTRNDVVRAYFSVTGPSGTVNYPAEGGRAWIPLPATGNYSINAVAVDEAGNQAQQSATVNVSASSSVATVSDPVNSSAVPGTAVTLRGYARFTAAGATQVDVSVSGGDTVAAMLDSPGAAFSAWSAAITLPAGEGNKTVTVTPKLGGTSGTAATLNLTLDATAPACSITTPEASATVTQTVAFAGTASDAGSGLARVEVSVDGGYTWQQAAVTGDAWSLSWDLGLKQDSVSYPARVRATDQAGNVTVAGRTVKVDNVPPTDLAPVTFDQPVGQHLAKDTSLSVQWNTPVDGSGTANVYWVADQISDTAPSTPASGASASATLNAVGDWYVHLMAQDAVGNQALYHFGPWHVRDMANTTFSARQQSIILDGFIDLAHNEWLAGDLLGTDAQGLETQQLYASWDGQAIYLGWSGAWWTLDGEMWAYLDVAPGGSTQSVGGGQALPIAADVAVLIDSPTQGSLYTWDGSAWVFSTDTNAWMFVQGSAGDTEARIVRSLTADQTVQLVAFALPRTVAESSSTALLESADIAGTAEVAGTSGSQPWVIFPNTNPLGGTLEDVYSWNTPDTSTMNADQPGARTVHLTVSTPQAPGTAWCAGSTLEYDIMLENPEPTVIEGLNLTLTATTGLSYQSVNGATLTSGAVGGANWTLSVSEIAAGGTARVTVTARTALDVTGLTEVASTIELSAGATPLTGQTSATVSHRVDGQTPTVSIIVPAGAAIPAGAPTFSGLASDGDESGVARVEVSDDGGSTWQQAVVGTLVWSAALSIPGEATTYTLQARAVDGCGRTSAVASQTFNVDSTAPSVSFSAPAVVTATAAMLAGSAYDPQPEGALVANVGVQVDGADSPWTMVASLQAPQDGAQAWAWKWAVPREDDGVSHTLRAQAVDRVGNRAVTDWQTTVVDVVAPQLSVTQPMTSVVLGGDPAVAEPVLGGAVTDGSGVQAVRVLVYDPLGNTFTVEASLTDGNWEYTPDLTGWAVGTYKLRVQAEDIHGNVRTQGPYTLEVQDAPIVGLEAMNDSPRMIGEAVTFTATVTAGTNVIYTWGFGDGAAGEGEVVQHAYTQSGAYTVMVTATNSASAMEATTSVTILALSVEAGPDQTANEGDNVSVATTFTDGRPQVTHTATIDWGDGTQTAGVVDEVAFTISGGHTYADNGAYMVTVTMSDSDQPPHSASDTLQVTVGNVAPAATLTNDGPKGEASAVTVSFTNVQDPGAADTMTYSFDWNNDGTYEIEDQAVASAQYTWPDNGTYTVKGQVKDDDGGAKEYTTIVTVNDVAPTIALSGADNVNEGAIYALTLGAITDPGTDTVTAWIVHWGDGASNTYHAGGDVTHTYADGPSLPAITVDLTDEDGTHAGAGSKSITINDVAPTIALSGASSVNEGAIYALTLGAITDPGADTVTAWIVHWGDGVSNTYYAGGNVTHVYADGPSLPTITVDLTDEDGAHTGAGSKSITINDVAPTIALSGADSVNEGAIYALTLGAITDPGADTVTAWIVHWGDGANNTYNAGGNVTHVYADGPANPTITVDLTNEDGTHTSAGSKTVTVNDVAPTIALSGAGSVNEGAIYALTLGAITDPGADTVTVWIVHWGDGNSDTYSAGGNVTHAYADGPANPTITVDLTDEDGTHAGAGSKSITVNNVAPVVTASPGSQTVQYSEAISEITFTATDVAADSMSAQLSWSLNGAAFSNGAPAGLALDGGSCTTSGSINTCTWKVTGNVGVSAGAYTLRLTVTDKDSGATPKDVTLTVQPEEATVAFDDANPVAVKVASPGGTSGPFTLRVCVSERDAALAGDISLAQVSMSLVSVGTGGSIAGAAGTPTVENGRKCVTFSFNKAPVNTYTVQVTVGGGYYVGAGEDVLVVYDPSLGFTTGGGWFYWPGTANAQTGYLGDKTNVGYTMKYNKKGGNVQGNLLLIRHLADGTIYRVKSNALNGLALGENATIPMGWASFSGKSTYQEPGWPQPVGNYGFTVYVEDRNEPGRGVDRFWIEVSGGLALPREAAANAVNLSGGDIVVPHRAR